MQLGSAGAPAVAAANGRSLKLSSGSTLSFPGGALAIPPQPEGVLPVDFNYDFKTDIVLAGAGGVRFFAQESPTSFRDVTANTKLPKTSRMRLTREPGPWTSRQMETSIS